MRRHLVNENRERLLQLVQARPGLGLREAGRRCGIAQGAMAYHVEYLEWEGRVSTTRYQGRRLLFPYKAPTGHALAMQVVLEDAHLFAIYEFVRATGPIAQQGIINQFPEPRSTIQARLDRLARHRLLTSSFIGRSRVYSAVVA